MPATRVTPRSIAAWSDSTSQSGIPASSSATAIPAPMVPTPITAACSSGRTDVARVMPSTLAAARSAKNACLSPFDSGVSISSRNARPLDREPLLERPARCFDRIQRAERRWESGPLVLEFPPCGLAEGGDARGVHRDVAGPGCVPGRDLRRGGEVDGRRQRIPIGHPVEEGGVGELLRGHRVAADDHVDRSLDADEARQALGAAGARQQPQLDLRKSERRVRGGDPVVRGHRQLEPPAETDAGYRRDDRLGARLDRGDDACAASAPPCSPPCRTPGCRRRPRRSRRRR